MRASHFFLLTFRPPPGAPPPPPSALDDEDFFLGGGDDGGFGAGFPTSSRCVKPPFPLPPSPRSVNTGNARRNP